MNLYYFFSFSVSCLTFNHFYIIQGAPDAVFSTAVTALAPEDAFDPNRVKCVVDNSGYAIYFSRGLIPFNKLVYLLFYTWDCDFILNLLSFILILNLFTCWI